MKRKKISSILICTLVFAMLIMSGCSKKSSKETTETSLETVPTPIPVETTTQATTSLVAHSGPEVNTLEESEITWTETALESTLTLYVATSSDYLNVRKGPDPDVYKEVVSKLPRGTAVTVVATTSNGWYKTEDGYYVKGDFLSASPVT